MTIFPQFKLPREAYPDSHERFIADFSGRVGRTFATYQIYEDIGAIAGEWQNFEARACGSFYQSALWCRAWLETVGRAERAAPRIVAGRDTTGDLVFLLPLQIRKRHGLRTLEWLTAPHATYGGGLFAPHFLTGASSWFADNWTGISDAIATWDAIALTNMPELWHGEPHPLRTLFRIAGPNCGYSMALEADYTAITLRKQSGESRRQDRKRLGALAAHGEIAFTLPASAESRAEAVRLLFRQQEARLAEHGIYGVFGPAEQAFIKRLSAWPPGRHAVLLPYVLSCGNEVLAIMLCARHGGTLWGLISSLAQSPLRRYSPGDLALRRCIEAGCKGGFLRFDFATGDTPYKRTWADQAMPLFEHHSGRNIHGIGAAGAHLLATAVKRLVKQNPKAHAMFQRLRKSLRGSRQAQATRA